MKKLVLFMAIFGVFASGNSFAYERYYDQSYRNYGRHHRHHRGPSSGDVLGAAIVGAVAGGLIAAQSQPRVVVVQQAVQPPSESLVIDMPERGRMAVLDPPFSRRDTESVTDTGILDAPGSHLHKCIVRGWKGGAKMSVTRDCYYF